ncbi:MAG: thiamine-phosphate kinase [Candidatus Wenzhouxiangella sp. M2_3B_020]
MNEFDLIAAIRSRVDDAAGVVLGIGDDAAVLEPGRGTQIVATADNLVAGRHFVDGGPHAATPAEIGHLALAVNLSDLAAMGARPRWSLLTLTLPDADPSWLDAFLDGYLSLSAEHGCCLVGGNLARGPLDISVTALGEVPTGGFVTRAGARPGDRIVVTGTLGDAAAALELDAGAGDALRERLLKPCPRVSAGMELATRARAVIDVSDGLLADLGHLAADLGAEIRADALPVSDALEDSGIEPERRLQLQCGGGGDYELLAALPADVPVPATLGQTRLTEIGRIDDSGLVRCVDADGNELASERTGWDHFGTE